MKTRLLVASGLVWLVSILGSALAGERSPSTNWLHEARFGVFMHFLPGDEEGASKVHEFDVEALAQQLETVGAKYFVLTLGQNSGYYNAPNRTYDQIAGYRAGQRCSTRDLPMDLYESLHSRGIRLMLYLPCQVPNRDGSAQEAFGLPRGAKDQPIDIEFAKKWADVIGEWSVRYGSKVAGWWFDGGYEWIGFHDQIADLYADAARRGNSDAIVTFNPGVKLIRWTNAEDYTAGELNDPFQVLPEDRWLEGSQWHALTYLGSHWGSRDSRFPSQRWASWVTEVAAKGGAVTLDAGANWNPNEGRIGTISDVQMKQLQAIHDALTRLDTSRFVPVEKEFHFDTSVLRGTLHAAGQSFGLKPVQHISSGHALAASSGLLSPYRLLTPQSRFGPAAWDWPSRATMLSDGAVRVEWAADPEHPLNMTGIYRLTGKNIIDLELSVCSTKDLQQFELFLASYFEGFPKSFAFTQRNNGTVGLTEATQTAGDWQMFPRDEDAVRMIQDGRWQHPPHPVNWIIREPIAAPLAVRTDDGRGLAAIVMAPAADCFAVSMPYGEEGHRSLYLSLFGRNLQVGEPATARARMILLTDFTEDFAIDAYRQYEQSLRDVQSDQ